MQNLNGRIKLSFTKGLLCAGAIFIIALGLGLWIEHARDTNYMEQIISSIKPIRENNFNYRYIFPLLSYDFTEANQFLRDLTLENQVDGYVADQIKKQNAQNISVYVRNLSDNRWAGTNEDTQYHPGSLLKVLIMMAYFRQAELDQTILEKNFSYSKDIAQQSAALNFSAPSNLTIGQSYPVKALMEDMIANSDNGAETLLINNVDRTILNNAYTDLNIPNPDSVSGDYTISARQYAAFLRILYNATYLSEDYSEQALSIMAKSTYRDGISAGVPANIVVAQKYGERVQGQGNDIQAVELHDCGVVYATGHPYTLCVMTKGQDIQKLTEIIKDISGLVYKNIVAKN
jgi:beta-lactamase class A